MRRSPPPGSYVAAVAHTAATYAVLTVDLETMTRNVIFKVDLNMVSKKTEMRIRSVQWKSDERLLVRTSLLPAKDVRSFGFGMHTIPMLGDRVFALDRDGRNLVRLLNDTSSYALTDTLDLGSVESWLPHDPDHVVMAVNSAGGATLFRVNVRTGKGEQVEPRRGRALGWWLGALGEPIVRVDWAIGAREFLRLDASGEWRVFKRITLDDFRKMPDFQPVGAAAESGKLYVLARTPGRDRRGLYLYDLETESFGEPVVEHPRYDLTAARITRDGTRVSYYCYEDHVRVCESTNSELNAHMKGVRSFFKGTSNVDIYEAAEDLKTLILHVDGPDEPPAMHFYRTDKRRIEPLGPRRQALLALPAPSAAVVAWQARDDLELSGYLSRPAGTTAKDRLPLIVYPHGGPEARDTLGFDPWVQFFTARGYAVFQPNFRGSDGYGEAFARRGYREWGRKMQDDVTDGVRHLIEQGWVDEHRICIVGASYGGFAALSGSVVTPTLYRCSVSVAGVTDLVAFATYRVTRWGADSRAYAYSIETIGDPKRDAASMNAASPAQQAGAIKVPVLLIHGDADEIVPLSQSELMKKALDAASNATELLVLEKSGHGGWTDENEKRALRAIDRFLNKHLNPDARAAE